MHFDTTNETYEIIMPTLTVHNLVVGKIYIDISETQTVVNMNKPSEVCEMKFEKRGWLSKETHKFTGEAFVLDGKKKNVGYTVEGNWNS